MAESPTFRIRPLALGDVDEVAALAREQFGDEDALNADLQGLVAQWQFARAPVVVARTGSGEFAGYARAAQLEVSTSPRPEGQVGVLRQLAVVGPLRGGGAGSALLERIEKTARMLGYSRFVAGTAQGAAGWLATHNWEVLAPGEGRVWIEPHIARDDLWLPDERSGVFSPVLTFPAGPGHPLQAWKLLGDAAPIVEALYGSIGQLDSALAAALAADPDAVAALPPKTRELLGV